MGAVPRQERDPPAGDGADGDRGRRVAVGGGDRMLRRVLDERVEAGAADDPDLRALRPRHGLRHDGNCASASSGRPATRRARTAASTTSSASATVQTASVG